MWVSVRQEQRCLRQSNTAATVFGTLLGILVMAYIIAILAQWYATAPAASSTSTCANSETVSETACPGVTDNSCVVGLLSADGLACRSLPRPNTATCTSPCYVNDSTSTYCDAAGACVGNTSECRGTCSGFCTAFDDALNDDIINSYDHTTFFTYVWVNPDLCFYGRCVLSVLDFFAGTLVSPIFHNNTGDYTFVPLGARNKCEDYLDPDFYAEQGSCIKTERYLIAPELINLNLFDDYENASYPIQFSVCLYYYMCSAIDESLLGAKRQASSIPIRTPAEHGFKNLGSVESEQALFSYSPAVRSLLFGQLKTSVQKVLSATSSDMKQALFVAGGGT